MGYALKKIVLEETTCCVCATVFAVDETIMANRRFHAGNIHCPNGHSIGWSESEADKVRKQLAHKQKELEAEQQRVQMERSMRIDAENARARADKELKRVKKRVNAGMCPHCNRTFSQLARHMKCKHADEPPNQ
jgi:hypothetical protein